MENLFKALSKFQAELKQPVFDSTVKVTTKTGAQYSFKYATLANIMECIKKPLTDNGLAIIQSLVIIDEKPCLKTILGHISGESTDSIYPLDNKGTMQDKGADITYLRRYQITCLLGIVADEDTDNNHNGNEKTGDFKKQTTDKSPENKQRTPEKKSERVYKPITQEELETVIDNISQNKKTKLGEDFTSEVCRKYWILTDKQAEQIDIAYSLNNFNNK